MTVLAISPLPSRRRWRLFHLAHVWAIVPLSFGGLSMIASIGWAYLLGWPVRPIGIIAILMLGPATILWVEAAAVVALRRSGRRAQAAIERVALPFSEKPPKPRVRILKDNWIRWRGDADCPVPPNTVVDTIHGNGAAFVGHNARYANEWRYGWRHGDSKALDIIFFRIQR